MNTELKNQANHRLEYGYSSDMRDTKLIRELVEALESAEVKTNFNLIDYLHRQRDFSINTFGPGSRIKGILDHIRKELIEVEAAPNDLEEWINVVMLALDGAWRAGHTPEQIAAQLESKLTKNETRDWPDWRTAEPGKAIEHVRGSDDTINKSGDQFVAVLDGKPVTQAELENIWWCKYYQPLYNAVDYLDIPAFLRKTTDTDDDGAS